jgi:hypothetical protein
MAAKRTASASDNGEMPAKRATGDGNFFPSILETAKAVANQSSVGFVSCFRRLGFFVTDMTGQ